jgi:hypothetical protein
MYMIQIEIEGGSGKMQFYYPMIAYRTTNSPFCLIGGRSG